MLHIEESTLAAQVHILDDRLRPVPEGETGTLWIGGIGLSPGVHLPSGLWSLQKIAIHAAAARARLHRPCLQLGAVVEFQLMPSFAAGEAPAPCASVQAPNVS